MNRFAGKVALVTGGGGALGRASALRFVEEGAQVVIADIDRNAARAVAEEIGSNAVAIAADVTITKDCEAMVQASQDTFGKLDVVFANAGIGGEKVEFVDMPIDEWDRVMAVNLRGNGAHLQSRHPRIDCCRWRVNRANGLVNRGLGYHSRLRSIYDKQGSRQSDGT